MKRVLPALALALAFVSPEPAAATCMAPRPERALMITPTATRMPAGSGFVLRGSQLVGPAVTLTGRHTLSLTGTEIAPHVLRFVLPQTIAAGRYEISAAYGDGEPAPIGTIEVRPAAPALAAPTTAPSGTITHTESEGRWAPNHDVTLTLTAPVSHGVAVVFDWTMSGTHFGSIAWVNAQSAEAALGGSGHCGGYPYGATLPTRGTQVRAAFIDERGQMGPWGTLTVR